MKQLYTASDVARFCQVDLKTIHNWVNKGEIAHFRTPGRHLRFKPVDVVAFLRKYGYTIPEELGGAEPETSPEQAADAPAGASSVRARVEQVFGNGRISVTIAPGDVAALRALEGREVLLAAAGAPA